ncbi:golgin subfamily A member 6-like protein 22 isoform X2 [Ricinus communis]|uniref:golgin subfamily A member 6-like protein 22 isoform X2 n=1 Tax=Ricinus communis TaxID=3988 RepID=UPI000772BB25|nr:golgin subfamily A member 6-like protein 22 isoform X2 [Ricinus communis]|eukprot:XP_015583798.1 golgin subfamily A member 6-like protein 22 isoform X2 [Ricinus communis]
MGSVNVFLRKKLVFCVDSFWVSVSTLFLALFHFLSGAICRVKDDDFSQRNDLSCTEQEANVTEFEDTKENDVLAKEEEEEEEETPQFFFKFQYQTYGENHKPFVSNSVSTATTNKYAVLSSKGSSLYLEKPEVYSLTVKELYADSVANNKEVIDDRILPEEKAETEFIYEESKEEVTEKLEAETSVEGSNLGNGMAINEEKNNAWSDHQVSRDDDKFLSEKDFVAPYDTDSDSDSITSSHEVINRFVPSIREGFLSDKNFEDAFEFVTLKGTERELAEELTEEEEMELDDIYNLQNCSSGYDPDDFDEEDSDILEELKNLEDSNMQNSDEKDVQGNDNLEQEEANRNDKETKECLDDSEKSGSQDSSAWDAEDSNGLESLWEHQELIEQLKMELKKVRATGLPTILEEDESPKIMEDLKPWKIDEKFQREDRMGELHKFYKSYRERMRKFDILNYQKMYALEDSIKDKRARRIAAKDDDNAITSDKLVEIMEESIRIFWRFVRADKDAHTVIQKSRRGTQIEPQDPTELELLTEVRTSLQKKEKKLKEKLRSGNCILKKFQKNQEESSSDQVLYFFSQVDMKLVSRVLNMSKITTDQLIWCSNKLDKINFVSRKIHVEPSFLLFPC